MTTGRRVLLMLGCSRASERGLLRGIVRYARLHEPWIFYREPPFYRRPPYHSLPRDFPDPMDRVRGRQSGRTLVSLRGRGLEGIVAFAAHRTQMETFIPPDFPCVILPIEEKIPGRCCIVEEAGTVGRMAAEHFLDRGFTRFAFCGFDHMYWSRVRQEGFVQRLAQAGHAAHLYEPPRRSADVPWETEQSFVADWLRSLPKPIGLMVCNDDRAQQVIEANKAAGTRIPDEIAVLGVDNDEMICELTHPPLSSIALNLEEAGYEAAAQLDRQMQGHKPAATEICLRPLYVHTRQSTDVLAVEDPQVATALRFIRTHAGDCLSVQAVVEAASTSRRLLERHFHQTVGTGIYREIQRVRIERACRMLAETNWSLADIAQRCGFSNTVHFSVAFKRQMDVTPEQHRRRDVAKSKDKDAKSNSPGPRSRRK
jgi:LacI family transcriptional regulator